MYISSFSFLKLHQNYADKMSIVYVYFAVKLISRALMMQKPCAVGMCNALLRNHLNAHMGCLNGMLINIIK